MQYKLPFTYFTSRPNGMKNLMWGTLCIFSTVFIPVVGVLVWMGYIVEVIRSLKQDPEILDHPDFEPNRFSDYINLGIWPFLMNLIIGLFIAFLVIVAYVIGILAAVVTEAPWVALLTILVAIIPISLLAAMLTWPMTLYTQMRGKLEFGSAISFTMSFYKLVGGQLFFSVLAHSLIAFALGILGLLVCCVGVFPVQALTSMAQEHFMVQLYRMYLNEGGDPIPEPEEKLPPRKKPRPIEEDDNDETELA